MDLIETEEGPLPATGLYMIPDRGMARRVAWWAWLVGMHRVSDCDIEKRRKIDISVRKYVKARREIDSMFYKYFNTRRTNYIYVRKNVKTRRTIGIIFFTNASTHVVKLTIVFADT